MTDQQALRTFSLVFTLFTALALALVFTQPASAQTESVLYSFTVGSGVGGGPSGSLIMDSAGNLYGVAGSNKGGAAYELIPSSGGVWTLKILVESSSIDVGPAAGLTMDAAGNLYGPSLYGGSAGYGTIFELKPISNGTWRLEVIHDFANNGTDGHYPGATLTMDAAGNLYGTTQEGGLKNVGVVFELTPYAGGGGWNEKILYSLPYKQKLWNNSNYPLTLDSAGNLYGVTDIGGAYGWGFVFKLTPTSKGPWTLTTLYSFNITPAPYVPFSGVVFDSAGNLYGVTALGGTEGYGTVYELSPSSGGGWTERDIVDFPSSCSPACKPESGVIIDSVGNLFGTTPFSGAYDFGSAYKVSPNGDGTWTLTGLHDFGSGTDGAYPGSGVLLDVSGKLYGTTIEGGGTKGRGTVFEITP